MKRRWKKKVAIGLCIVAGSGTFVGNGAQIVKAAETATVDLVPDTANAETPNYVCTWSFQDWAAQSDHYTPVRSGIPRDMLNHDQLFNKETGWVTTSYPESRKDLIYLLDDGWDLPYGGDGNYFGSLIVDPKKFPNYGETPEERLTTLVKNIEDAGWKGAGIWICAGEMAGENNKGWNEAYWRERLEWSAKAGVDYWKIDWGGHSGDSGWRQMISNLADEIAPDLIIEHITGYGTINDGSDNGTRLDESSVDRSAYYASFSDVYRTYDVNGNLSIPTTFERIGRQLETAYTNGAQKGLINGEDEVYMCAALGLTFGVMRYDMGEGVSSGSLPNIFFGGDERFTETRPIRKMLDEVQRATMWQRIAPAYRIDAYQTKLSDKTLEDYWYYEPNNTWHSAVHGKTIYQKAPAVIARGIAEPMVQPVADGKEPFVAASRNPNGAISIGAYGRTDLDGYQKAPANVALEAGSLTGPIGVFGYYNSLSFTFEEDIRGKEIYAQDLIGDTAENITNDSGVNISDDGKTITFDGKLLEKIGLSAATEEYSEPGLVIRIGEEFQKAPETNYVPKSMVANSSFELEAANSQQSDAMEWEEWGAGDAIYIEEGDAHSGKKYAVQKKDSDYEGGMKQTVWDIPTGVYDVSVWVKASEHTKGGDPADCCITVKDYGGDMLYEEVPATDEWTEVKISGVPVTNGKMVIEMYSNANAGEYVFYDDFTIEKNDDLETVAPLVQASLDTQVFDNSVTAETLKEAVEKALFSYEKVTCEIRDFTKKEATDDVEGELRCTIKLLHKEGEEITFEYVKAIPRTSLVYNSSMEIASSTGAAPTGWSTWGTENKFYVENKTEEIFSAHTGDWYGACWGQSYEGGVYQVLENLPTGNYKASVWVKNTEFSAEANPSSACFVVKDFGMGTTGEGLKYVDFSKEAHDEWTKLEIEDIRVTNGQMQLEIYAKADSGDDEWIIFDDFEVKPYEYAVNVIETSNGVLEVTKQEAVEGTKIMVTVLPDSGYRLKEGTLKVIADKSGEEVELNGTEFLMPGSSVTVTAEFEPATPVTDPDEPTEEKKVNLKKAIDMANKLKENQEAFTTESWKRVETALQNAEVVMEKQEVTQEEVDQVFLELITECNLLVTAAQKTGLRATIAGAEEILNDSSQYTEDSVAKVEEALKTAKEVEANPEATQEEINLVSGNLMGAVTSLLAADSHEQKERLEILLAKAEELAKETEKYTQSSLDKLNAAMAAAQEALNGTEEEQKEAYNNLVEAITSLERKANKSELSNAIAKANEILENSSQYVGETLENLEQVRDAAQQIYDEEAADIESITAVLETLIQEILQVRKLGDVDGNGDVNSADAAKVLAYTAEMEELSEEDKQAGDVNLDGASDSADAVEILRYAAESITEF